MIVFGVNDLVNQNSEYFDVDIKIGMIPTFLALLPLTYLIPTIYVIFCTIQVYFKTLYGKSSDIVNPHVMLIIILHEISTFGYMLSDYGNFRIPSTGVMTAWCARQEPSKLLIIIYASSIYCNYLSMMFPLLLAVMRLIPIYYPTTSSNKSRKLVRAAIPFILLYPFAYIFVLFPAHGVCRQYPPPFQFGAVFLHYVNSWKNIGNHFFIMLNATFWFILAIIANTILYRKLRKLGGARSIRYQKAERTLTLTTTSMMVSYLCNTVFMIVYSLFVSIAQWFILLRPFGNDCDLVVVPWVFFLVHPAFRHKSLWLRNYATTVKPFRVRSIS